MPESSCSTRVTMASSSTTNNARESPELLLSFMKIRRLAGVALLATSCQGATQPTASPSRPDVLVIASAADALKLGSDAALTAAIVSGDGARKVVTATWSSDAPDVVSIQSDGHVFGSRLGRSTIHA